MGHERDNYWKRRLSRRSVLASGTAAGTGLVAASLVGCGDDDDDDDDGGSSAQPTTAAANPTAAATPTQGPKRGGELKISLSAQTGHMHPQQSGGSELVRYNVYDHLVLWDFNNDKPDFIAAESYETPEPTRLIYHIRQAANWQNIDPLNGRTVTSQDIDTSWKNYAADPKATGATTIHKVLTDHRETPEEKILVQVFKAPSVPIFGPHGIAGPIPSLFAPPELWESGQLGTKAVGSGAYVVEKFDGTSEIVLRRRPDSWNGLERPYIDKITQKVITDEAARAAALRAGQLDVLVARDKIQADEFKSYNAKIVIDKQVDFPAVLMMHAGKPPFSDPRVRQAIYAGLDIQDLIDRVVLGEGFYSSFVPPFLAADALPEAEVKKRFPHDVKKAKDLLTAAAYDTSQEIELKFPSDPVSKTLVETLQQQLAAIGIKTKLIPQDPTTVWAAQTVGTKKNFVLTAAYQYTRGLDADQWLGNQYKNGNGNGNACDWANDETDALFEKSRVEFDRNARHEILIEMQKKLFDAAAPWINLYAPIRFTARWNRYHPVNDRGHAGTLGHYHWLES
jgi:peptide/nickel transport system substrate-binding protein